MGIGTDGPLLRSRLIADGFRDHEARSVGRRLVTVRPGAYVAPRDRRLQTPEGRHLLAVRAAVAQLGPGAVVSHASAAVVHGIAVWNVPLDRVHLTRAGRSGGRRSRHLHLHVAALDADEIVTGDGIRVTSVARTVADLLRALPFEQAVVVADSALHLARRVQAGLRHADLVAAVDRGPRRHGNGAAGRALAFCTDLAESVGESRSRVAIAAAGLPAPALQVALQSAEGRSLGRVDFWWERAGVVGEFDGRVKYGRLLQPGQSPGDAVFAEKVREDALREPGRRVVRWIWDDLNGFDRVARALGRALGR